VRCCGRCGTAAVCGAGPSPCRTARSTSCSRVCTVTAIRCGYLQHHQCGIMTY
jgi:hypothetical protein